MPRQNESVNELWICDKGRFAHHYASEGLRLPRPMIRRQGVLVETTWEEALARVSDGLQSAHTSLVGLAGGRASNEDLFNFRRLVEGLGGTPFLHANMSGGEWVQKAGLGSDSNLGHLGKGDAILVVASDLHQEAPVWWLRIKQAVERGAVLVVLGARPTRLEKHATHVLRHTYGDTEGALLRLLNVVRPRPELAKAPMDETVQAAASALASANRLVVFFGQEGIDFGATEAVARDCVALLSATGHAGKPDCGLVPVWPQGNVQGAWDVGLWPDPDRLQQAFPSAKALLVMAADPLGDNSGLAAALPASCFVVVQELTMTETARRADVVLPAQSFVERQGSYTTGERRVQRFYPAIRPQGEAQPDYEILARIGRRSGVPLHDDPSEVMQAIAAEQPDYSEITYQALAHVEPQWPLSGGDDLYLGGTAYKNFQGLGVALPSAAERGEPLAVNLIDPETDRSRGTGLLLVPISRLLDRGATVLPSTLLSQRLADREIRLHPDEARRHGLTPGEAAEVQLDGRAFAVQVRVEEQLPMGVALVPRSVGIPIDEPTRVEVNPVRPQVAP
jgi:NADH-quinone oxidoreductase subunit G